MALCQRNAAVQLEMIPKSTFSQSAKEKYHRLPCLRSLLIIDVRLVGAQRIRKGREKAFRIHGTKPRSEGLRQG